MSVVTKRASKPDLMRGLVATGPMIAALVDESSEALVALAPDGRVLFWSRGAVDMFGYHAREAVGYTLDWLIGTSNGHKATDAFAELSRGPMSYVAERRRKDRSRLRVSVTMRRYDDSDAPFIVARLRQIVDDEALRALDQGELEASRLKGEFLANVSHELRTPLNTIIGFAELLHKGKAGKLAEQHAEFVADILTSSRQLLQLVNDIVDLSKLESGTIALHPEPTDVKRVIEEVHDLVRGLAAKKHLELEIVVARTLSEVVTDPLRFKQVVYAYVSNAIKFTRDRGRVVIRVEPEPGDMFRLEVEDDGIGIAESDQRRLFVEFQRLDARAQSASGRGLGLALAQRIVGAQGGRVAVRSAPDRGSTFFAYFPTLPCRGANAG